MSVPIAIFALITRGLESVSRDELAAVPGVTATGCGYRRVTAVAAGSLEPLLGLRTVDDVFIDLATWRGIGRHRAALNDVRRASGELDLRPAIGICAGLRPVPRSPAFAISASFVGRRNYGVEDLKAAMAAGVTGRYGWRYCARDADADLSLRLFVEHETAYLGIRLGRVPLQQRAYRRVERPGALKPSVAAALLGLAGIESGMRILDPCCGSGTIAIEAALAGAEVICGDCDSGALAATQANASSAGVCLRTCLLDARALPLANGSVDRVVTNLPWGRTVGNPEGLPDLYRHLVAEAYQVLVPGGRVVLLTSQPDLVHQGRFRCREEREISFYGQTPTVVTLYGLVRMQTPHHL